MIPHPWPALVLALAAYRLTRLAGWDDFPPIYKLRARLIRERWLPQTDPLYDPQPKMTGSFDPGAPETLPGKQPQTEVPQLRVAYGRPLLAHFVHCPFCLGFWVSVAVYVWWLVTPGWGWYPLVPFALSGVVGLIAKDLDA